jgi:hypothetical protein
MTDWNNTQCFKYQRGKVRAQVQLKSGWVFGMHSYEGRCSVKSEFEIYEYLWDAKYCDMRCSYIVFCLNLFSGRW